MTGGDFYFKNEINCKRGVRWMCVCVCCSLVLKPFEGFVSSRSQAINFGNARVSVDCQTDGHHSHHGPALIQDPSPVYSDLRFKQVSIVL